MELVLFKSAREKKGKLTCRLCKAKILKRHQDELEMSMGKV